VQLASAQLSPRIIGLVFQDPVTKGALSLFVFTFALSVAVVLRIGDSVPLLTVRLSAYSCVFSVCVFLYLVDHIGKILRPNKALRSVALLGRQVIESVYPRALSETPSASGKAPDWTVGEQSCSVPARKDGVILACDIAGIVALAQHSGCVLEMVPQVGDFVATGTPLFHVYGDVTRLNTESLRQMIAIGQERSLEQDPAFCFRIIVDIASKALSPAINDPTTAVLAIDQIHHLLRTVGGRDLDDERVRDAQGRTRLVYRTPGWSDFVHLAVTEIRHYGAESIQVTRRLRAMLDSLIELLPPDRALVLQRELEMLNRGATRVFTEPNDRATAAGSDSQGMGGKTENAGSSSTQV
jgi:uncharacterized membrane protein